MRALAEHYSATPTRYRLKDKNPSEYKNFIDQLAANSALGITNTMRGVQSKRAPLYSYKERIAALNIPALVVLGEEDEPCIKPSHFLKENLPGARLEIVREDRALREPRGTGALQPPGHGLYRGHRGAPTGRQGVRGGSSPMKLVLFQSGGTGEITPGILTDRGVVSIAKHVKKSYTPQLTMNGIIDDFDELKPALERAAATMKRCRCHRCSCARRCRGRARSSPASPITGSMRSARRASSSCSSRTPMR